MTTTALCTLMENGFQHCLVKGTSVQEEGLRVSIKPLKDETIRFYRTDCEPARDTLSINEDGQKTCDYVVLYLKDINNDQKEIFCFLELKGSDFGHAVSQILNTTAHMNAFLEDRLDRNKNQYVVPCVCICMHGRAPSLLDDKRHRKRLYPFFKNDEHIHVRHGVSRYTELGQFLRKLYVK